ncbi:hypothetical protein COO60DRAFT_1562244 [Scenedesmus sp. NREL 46B-D3]|nr:hypothetical protein COO60DRAFT_1562244 [Scenedesmus sp. NREL 46B-D3]
MSAAVLLAAAAAAAASGGLPANSLCLLPELPLHARFSDPHTSPATASTCWVTAPAPTLAPRHWAAGQAPSSLSSTRRCKMCCGTVQSHTTRPATARSTATLLQPVLGLALMTGSMTSGCPARGGCCSDAGDSCRCTADAAAPCHMMNC